MDDEENEQEDEDCWCGGDTSDHKLICGYYKGDCLTCECPIGCNL